jgi:hypothetical protein
MMGAFSYSHYDYLEEHLFSFLEAVGVDTEWCRGIISAHGDKAYGYKSKWEKAGIPFPQGVAIYLLTYVRPYGQEVRKPDGGWVDASQWVVDNYDRFKEHLPDVPAAYYEDY